jgi:hypothetical protein
VVTVSLNAWTLVIAILSVVAGYVSNAVQTGKLLGIKTVPQSWLPVLTLTGTFLTAFVQTLAGASSVTGTTVLQAVLAGLTALTGATVGITIHQHMTATPSVPANDNGADGQKAA